MIPRRYKGARQTRRLVGSRPSNLPRTTSHVAQIANQLAHLVCRFYAAKFILLVPNSKSVAFHPPLLKPPIRGVSEIKAYTRSRLLGFSIPGFMNPGLDLHG